MALSKSTKIWLFLGIDTAFFLLEISIGYAAHSLALVADSFHMLNDVLSLCVGLWAVKVANERPSSQTFTYGWSRAETLGALINGVFLVALCLSIFLEAIQRFVEPQEVSNPKLVLIVGCFGLAFNILGLLLFHDHSHGHGDETEHSHEQLVDVEEGIHQHTPVIPVEPGHYALNETAQEQPIEPDDADKKFREWTEYKNEHSSKSPTRRVPAITFDAATHGDSKTLNNIRSSTNGSRSRRSRGSSRGIEDFPIHPASFRNEIIAQAMQPPEEDSDVDGESEQDDAGDEDVRSQHSRRRSDLALSSSLSHSDHKHVQNSAAGGDGHGHSHGDMNMKGIFLHVMGDALGNVGVILSALIIWKTSWSFRFYFDPLISLGITVIILCSAIPLCKASSKILLQASPQHISVDDIKADIESLPGIKSCHHLHVWQLTPSKLVASLHVQVNFGFQGAGAARYMELAQAMRACLHGYDIHSSTIQPEFCVDPAHEDSVLPVMLSPADGPSHSSSDEHRQGNGKGRAQPQNLDGCGTGRCLLDCDDLCGNSRRCCKPGNKAGSGATTPKVRDE